MDALEEGRRAFARQDWAEAYARLTAADARTALDPADLGRLAVAAYLVGESTASQDAWTRAYRENERRGDVSRAARCAFWLGFELLSQGERTRAGAWTARGRRLIEAAGLDCVEQGYLEVAAAHGSIADGDLSGAYDRFCRAAELGERFREPDLLALARHSRGRILIRMGRVQEGVALLDEAMVDVETGELSPLVVGDVYCSVIEGCMEVLDVRRAKDWTAALTRWCDSQPDLVPFTGQCLVRRAELLLLHGAWADAAGAAERACERFQRGPPQPAVGAAFYQQAELHRLRGEFERAEEAYRLASRAGRGPQPGLARLRLAQGRSEAAESALRRALDEAGGWVARAALLPAQVEILLDRGDVASARRAADQLVEISENAGAELLRAEAAHARGAVLLAGGEAGPALPELRRASKILHEMGAPYERARVRVLIGLACRALADEDAADLELDAARTVFRELGAGPDLARVEALASRSGREREAGLSGRELQVLRLVAAGKTNRAIAGELKISERTVERHLSNIFGKLGVSSRSAATAWAYERRLV